MCDQSESGTDLEFQASETAKEALETSINETPSEKTVSYLLSRKFIAFLVSVNVGLLGFIVIYAQTKEAKLYSDYLDFLLWSLVAYTGGNSLGKLTEKMVKK